MKKRIFAMLIITLFLSVSIVPAVYATECPNTNVKEENIVYLADGSYMITAISEDNICVSMLYATKNKSGSKTSTVYSAAGEPLYSLTVHATFSYNGSSATAVSSSYSYTDESPLWSFSGASSYCSGATAMASGTFKSSLQSKTLNVSLTCSVNGTLS